jgi:hypothetical protein
MATNITKTNNQKSRFEIIKAVRNGIEVEIVCIDGIQCGTMGYVNEADRKAGIDAIQKIVDNSNKRGYGLIEEVAEVLYQAAQQKDAGVPANATPEEVTINGKKFMILYDKKGIYNDVMTQEIANCRDLPDVSKEAIKAILIKMVKNI